MLITIRNRYRRPPSPGSSWFGIALLAALGLALGWLAAARGPELAAKIIRRAERFMTPAAILGLDRDTAQFNVQAASVTNAAECFPLHIRDEGKIGLLLVHCSDHSLAKDGEGVVISRTFEVPAGIARRYNFWRRIYSLWGKDQYVMHLSEYPEVVVEAYDASRVPAGVSDGQREIMVKRVAKQRRDAYRKLFVGMHQLRKTPEKFGPAMQRLARAMAHVASADKYLIASRSLRLQRGQRDFIAKGLSVAPKYFPAIEEEFRGQDVPVEITRLAFVESSFNLAAHSKVGASGVYQIMPATGRQYLKMHSGIDERHEPIKASRAAAKLLRLNYGMTGSWPLAITAYNHGVGGIRRAMRAVGSQDLVELINRYHGPQFGFASKNFYASFLGVLATLKDADRLFPEVPRVEPLAFQNVRLAKATSLQALKKLYGVTAAEVAELNPDISRPLLRSGLLPAGYVLKVPARSEKAELTKAQPNS